MKREELTYAREYTEDLKKIGIQPGASAYMVRLGRTGNRMEYLIYISL